jgi:predicted transcriptional regulator
MSKTVLISIRPQWCEKIVNGEKTIEVRKTRPKLAPPFKAYIYCTMPDAKDPHNILELHGADGKIRKANGKVIGEFTCDRIDRLAPANDPYGIYDIDDDYVFQTCLENGALWDYGHGTPLYGWHISGLRIYDAPKKLGEFWRDCLEYSELSTNCWSCENVCGDGDETDCNTDGRLYLHRPPQSWCYVEAVEDE